MKLYDINVTKMDGTTVPMQSYRGKVLLIVNVASNCGYTPQYDALQKLYEAHKDQGFAVLAFPCNQFANQEPGTPEEIQSFCRLNYGVTFDIFEKIDVNGNNAHPLYQHLKNEAPGLLGSKSIKWNFTKFLIDQTGNVVARYGSSTKPESLETAVERLLR